jgi:hypothetical protein
MGQESALRDLFVTLAQLPARPFQTVAPRTTTLPTQPLTVRSWADEDQTYVYVVNDSPWSVRAEIDIHSPNACQLRTLGRVESAQPTWLDGQLIWALDMKPFDVQAAVVTSDKATVHTWRVTIDRATYAQLREQVEQLKTRTLKLSEPDPIQVLANPGFENSAERLPGWIASPPRTATTIGPDATTPAGGKLSLRMVKDDDDGQAAWIRSDPFKPPKSGRIAVMVHIRTDHPERQPDLRVAIDGTFLDGRMYYDPRNVGLKSKHPVGRDWTSFLLPINNLPTSQLANIRIGFDLMGPGTVWIDDVVVYDNWFLKHERDDLMIMRGLAARSLDTGRITDCRRILNGYWSQFLMRHVSPEVTQVASLPASDAGQGNAFPPPQPSTGNENASMLDKMKRLPSRVFPFRLR